MVCWGLETFVREAASMTWIWNYQRNSSSAGQMIEKLYNTRAPLLIIEYSSDKIRKLCSVYCILYIYIFSTILPFLAVWVGKTCQNSIDQKSWHDVVITKNYQVLWSLNSQGFSVLLNSVTICCTLCWGQCRKKKMVCCNRNTYGQVFWCNFKCNDYVLALQYIVHE